MEVLQLFKNKYKSRKVQESEIYNTANISETVLKKHNLMLEVRILMDFGLIRQHKKKGCVTRYSLTKSGLKKLKGEA